MLQLATFGIDGDGTDLDGYAPYRGPHRPTLREQYGDNPAQVPLFTHNKGTGRKRYPRRREGNHTLPSQRELLSDFEILGIAELDTSDSRPWQDDVIWINFLAPDQDGVVIEVVTSTHAVEVRPKGDEKDLARRLNFVADELVRWGNKVSVDRVRYVPTWQRERVPHRASRVNARA